MKPDLKEVNRIDWKLVSDYCNARIDQLRKDNDGDKDKYATAKLRGRIESFKEILRAGEPPTREVVADTE